MMNAYASMMSSDAWQDLKRWAENQRDESISKQDAKAASDLNINVVCEDRGIRKGIAMLMRHAEQKREGV